MQGRHAANQAHLLPQLRLRGRVIQQVPPPFADLRGCDFAHFCTLADKVNGYLKDVKRVGCRTPGD